MVRAKTLTSALIVGTLAASSATAQSIDASPDGGVGGLLVQFVPLALILAVWAVPLLHLLKRTGRNRWWGLLCLLPGIGPLILVYMIAYQKWPKHNDVAGAFD